VRALIILAFDPGPVRWGWALLSMLSTPRGTAIRWLDGNHEEWATALCVCLIDRALSAARGLDGDVLVVSEIVTGKLYRGRSDANVLDTSRACGRATPVAEAMAILALQGRLAPQPVIATAEYTTHDWRAVLSGYKDAPQEAVNACARGVVADLPPLPKRIAEHVYDALGLGIAAGYVLRRGHSTVPLPPQVTAEIAGIVDATRRAAQARRSASQLARELQAAGVDIPIPARGTRRRRSNRSAKQRWS
jgi:hypothetical protein